MIENKILWESVFRQVKRKAINLQQMVISVNNLLTFFYPFSQLLI